MGDDGNADRPARRDLDPQLRRCLLHRLPHSSMGGGFRVHIRATVKWPSVCGCRNRLAITDGAAPGARIPKPPRGPSRGRSWLTARNQPPTSQTTARLNSLAPASRPQRCQSQFVWSRPHLLQRVNNVKVARRLDRFVAPDVLIMKGCLNPMLQNDNKLACRIGTESR
jgi:hypothetical protein